MRTAAFWTTHLPALVWTAFCTWLLLMPSADLGDAAQTTERFEELGHGVLIFVLGWLLARSFRRLAGGSTAAGWWGIAAAVVYSIALEIAQRWVPGRGFEWIDIASSVAGALAAAELPGSVDSAGALTARPAAR